MSKFKIGDRVRFCSKINPDKRGFKNGDIFTIQALSDFTYSVNRTQAYSVGKIYVVFENELTLITNSEIHITTDGKTTHAVLKENGKVTKRAKADCSPDDDFDFKVGARLAFNRLMGTNLINGKLLEKKEEFKPYLTYNFSNKKIAPLGNITNLKDLAHTHLYTGDTVDLYSDIKGYIGERVVCGDDFVMSVADRSFPAGRNESYIIIKKRSYTEIADGEIVGSIKYIKSEEMERPIK